MLQVYDRVLPSRHVPTLVALFVLVTALYAFQGILDMTRGRLLVRIGAFLDEQLSGRVYDVVVRLPLKTQNRADGLQSMRDLDQLRSFLSGTGPTALCDLPWMPLYLGIWPTGTAPCKPAARLARDGELGDSCRARHLLKLSNSRRSDCTSP